MKNKMFLLTISPLNGGRSRVDEYVKQNDPVRVYDVFVESLKFEELAIVIDSNQVGRYNQMLWMRKKSVS